MKTRSTVLLGALCLVLVGTSWAGDPPGEKQLLRSVTRRVEITAEVQTRCPLFRKDVRFFDGTLPAAPGRRAEHVLIAEVPWKCPTVTMDKDGEQRLGEPRIELEDHAVRGALDLCELVGAVTSSDDVLAFARFMTDPLAGPSLVPYVELRPRVVTPEAEWVFSADMVAARVGDGPRVVSRKDGSFVLAPPRQVVSLKRLADLSSSVPVDPESVRDQLSAEQVAAVEAGGTVHVLEWLSVAAVEGLVPPPSESSSPVVLTQHVDTRVAGQRLLVVRLARA
jgi:hypothetical protein